MLPAGYLQRTTNGLSSTGLPSSGKKVAIRKSKKKSKLDLGTSKFESSTSDFPPEGPKKESCVILRDFRGGQKKPVEGRPVEGRPFVVR